MRNGCWTQNIHKSWFFTQSSRPTLARKQYDETAVDRRLFVKQSGRGHGNDKRTNAFLDRTRKAVRL